MYPLLAYLDIQFSYLKPVKMASTRDWETNVWHISTRLMFQWDLIQRSRYFTLIFILGEVYQQRPNSL